MAHSEVNRILDVTMALLEKSGPALPAVADIVSAAGISNQTLYRTFGSKDELILAVLERGVLRVEELMRDRMANASVPRNQVVAWIRVVLRQVSAVDAAQASRSVVGYLHAAGTIGAANQVELMRPLTALLEKPLTALGCDPRLDGDCVSDVVFGRMRRHLWNATAPTPAEVDAVVRFVLRGLGVGPGEEATG
jgi:AcrR family transcriptional regulator